MSDTSDLDQQIEQLRKCEIIKESEVKNLCAKAREILGKHGNETKISRGPRSHGPVTRRDNRLCYIFDVNFVFSGREQRPEDRLPRHSLRGHSRTVLRSQGVVQGGTNYLERSWTFGSKE